MPIAVGKQHYFHEPIAPINRRYAMMTLFIAKLLAIRTFPWVMKDIRFA